MYSHYSFPSLVFPSGHFSIKQLALPIQERKKATHTLAQWLILASLSLPPSTVSSLSLCRFASSANKRVAQSAHHLQLQSMKTNFIFLFSLSLSNESYYFYFTQLTLLFFYFTHSIYTDDSVLLLLLLLFACSSRTRFYLHLSLSYPSLLVLLPLRHCKVYQAHSYPLYSSFTVCRSICST